MILIKLSKEEVRLRARKDRDFYGFGDREPIDIHKVIRFMEKATIIKTPLENLDGFYKIMGDAKLIVINSNMALARQNFTLAHELYHLKYDDSRHDYDTVEDYINAIIYDHNYLRPSYALNYKTPIEYRTQLGFK